MAKPPKSKDSKPRQKTPKKTPQQERAETKQNLRKLIEAEQEKLELERYIRREDVRMAMGIGNFKDWQNQVEANYVGSVPTQPPGKAVEPTRPKIKKVSKRKKRK